MTDYSEQQVHDMAARQEVLLRIDPANALGQGPFKYGLRHLHGTQERIDGAPDDGFGTATLQRFAVYLTEQRDA